MPDWCPSRGRNAPKPADERPYPHRRSAVSRLTLALLVLVAMAGAVVAYRDPEQVARASDTVSQLMRKRATVPTRAVQIARGPSGEFALQARINGVSAPMVIDTGAT